MVGLRAAILAGGAGLAILAVLGLIVIWQYGTIKGLRQQVTDVTAAYNSVSKANEILRRGMDNFDKVTLKRDQERAANQEQTDAKKIAARLLETGDTTLAGWLRARHPDGVPGLFQDGSGHAGGSGQNVSSGGADAEHSDPAVRR